MAPVSTTQTLVDAQAAHKELQAEVTKLKQERDLVREELTLWERALGAVKEAYKAHTSVEVSAAQISETIGESFRARREELEAGVRSAEARLATAVSDGDVIAARNEAARIELVAKKAELSETQQCLEAARADSQVSREEHERTMVDHRLAISLATAERTKLSADIEAIRKEVSEKTAWILAEERRLSNKDRDLAIYEERLNKRIAAAGLAGEIKIILK